MKPTIKSCLSDKNEWLFFLACIFITFNIFPFDKYGMGAAKCLSIIPVLLYFVVSLINGRLRIKDDNNFNVQLVLIGLMMIISLYRGYTIYNDTAGFSTAIGMWGSYFVLMASFITFLYHADELRMYMMFRCILYSFRFSFFFGILEFVYFQISNSSFIESFITCFVRDSVYIEQGRLQLNFGEPGDAGQILPGLMFPTILILKKMRYKFSLVDKIVIIGNILLLTLYSKSASFFAVSLVALVVYYNDVLNKFKIYRWFKPVTLLFLFLFGSALVIGEATESLSQVSGLGRVVMLLSNPENAFAADQSSATRFGLWVASIDIFKDNYIWGIGLGNFGYAYKQVFSQLDAIYQTPEMYSKLSLVTHQTYSIISTAFTEGGLIGCLWLLVFLRPLVRSSNFVRAFAVVFLIISLQNMVIYSFTYLFIYVMLSNSKIMTLYDKYEINKN